MNRGSWLAICGVTLCVLYLTIWNEYHSSNANIKPGQIFIANQKHKNSDIQKFEREKIERIASSRGISIQQVEDQIAEAIINLKNLTMKMSGGRGPGIYFLSDDKKTKIDQKSLMLVPAGHIIDFKKMLEIERDFLTEPAKLSDTDREMYISPIDVSQSALGNARFLGYTLGGAYLKGSGYAQTERLKQLEQTPSGKTGWTTLTRAFSDDGGLGYVVLEESDYGAAGIVVTIPQSSINTKVGDYPATLIRFQDQSGLTMSSLEWWGSTGKSYSLKISNIDDTSVASLSKLAESLAGTI